jgi:HD-like signal output (HDOD) protein
VFSAANSPALVRDRLLVHPKAAQRVLELLARPDGAHGELCSLVELDPALTAAVLRTANSVHLGYSRRIAGIRHATVMLGGSLVASLAASRVADLVFDVSRPDYPDGLWQHSVVVASACAVLAPEVGETADDAYTTGMLHDVGTLMAAANRDTDTDTGTGTDTEGRSPSSRASAGPMQDDLVDAGADLLRRWNLPDKVVDGVRHHRARPAALVGNLERLVAAAGSLAAEMGAGGPEKTMSPIEALRLVQTTRRPDEVMAAIDDDVTRRTAIVRGV